MYLWHKQNETFLKTIWIPRISKTSLLFPLQNNLGSYSHKAFLKFRQGRSNIWFLLDIILRRQYHIVLCLKLLQEDMIYQYFFLLVKIPYCNKSVRKIFSIKKMWYFQRFFVFHEYQKHKFFVSKITLVEFTIKHISNFVEEHQIYCLCFALSYGHHIT